MEALIGLAGVGALIAAGAWMVSPLARWHLRRLGVAVLAIAVAMVVGTIAWHELVGSRP